MTTESDHIQPELFGSATQVFQSQSWFTARFGAPRLISVGIHGVLVGLALVPWASTLEVHSKFTETAIVLYTPAVTKPLFLPAGGGGGGGKRQPTPGLARGSATWRSQTTRASGS